MNIQTGNEICLKNSFCVICNSPKTVQIADSSTNMTMTKNISAFDVFSCDRSLIVNVYCQHCGIQYLNNSV